jgi:hypothetical protein
MRFLAALVVLMLAGGCAEKERGPYVYKLSAGGWEMWAAPATGGWRSEGIDSSGARQVHVYSSGRYFNSIGENHSSARVGSPAFLGPNGKAPRFLLAVRRHEPLSPGDVVDGFQVEERIPLEEAERRGLFDVPVSEAAWLARELEPGRPPTVAVEAYWFGSELDGRRAFTAVEYDSPDETVHITCYADPNELAAGKTHCLAAKGIPRREVQVISRPLDQHLPRRELARLERQSAGRQVTLANGERVIVYPRAIVTATTLVTIGGAVHLRDIAQMLRPL